MYSAIGYHGTYEDNSTSILEVGFFISDNPRDWLGKGVYFFEESFEGKENAKRWAYKKWHNERRPMTQYCILKSRLETDYLLDLSHTAQIQYFHKIREEYIKRAKITGISAVELDCMVMNKISNTTRIDIVRKFEHIKFRKETRLNISSRVDNCIIVCVKNILCIKNMIIDEKGEYDGRSEVYL